MAIELSQRSLGNRSIIKAIMAGAPSLEATKAQDTNLDKAAQLITNVVCRIPKDYLAEDFIKHETRGLLIDTQGNVMVAIEELPKSETNKKSVFLLVPDADNKAILPIETGQISDNGHIVGLHTSDYELTGAPIFNGSGIMQILYYRDNGSDWPAIYVRCSEDTGMDFRQKSGAVGMLFSALSLTPFEDRKSAAEEAEVLRFICHGLLQTYGELAEKNPHSS